MSVGRVLIVGGGASGIILANRLLTLGDGRLRVAIVEKRDTIGAGLAYGTDDPVHLLNTRAGSMSAVPQESDHFWRWLISSGAAADLDCSDPFCFVPRRLYRRYLQDLVGAFLPQGGDGRLQIIDGECVDVGETAGGVALELADGRTEIGQIAVLATGHSVPASSPGAPYASAWRSPSELGIGPRDEVAILGTGLSMIDNVTQLKGAGHEGRITALSRRGLLPQVHRRSTPLRLDPADIPFGTDTSFLLAWMRRTVIWATERGGDWRDVVDALRPHTQGLWQSLSPAAKARFLRHARTFWEVHRHRMPPQIDQSVRAARANGQLVVLAGRLLGIAPAGGRKALHIRRRGGGEETLLADQIIDCTGILRDPAAEEGGLVAALVDKGRARVDALRIGIETDADCALVAADGSVSGRLFAVGPLTRARFWEITAIPDIRLQCAALATTIAARLESGGR